MQGSPKEWACRAQAYRRSPSACDPLCQKGDLLYPHLKVKYEISGPSDVMWTVDDEIRDEFAALAKKADSQDDEWKKRFEAALTRADEMIYKEANILFLIAHLTLRMRNGLESTGTQKTTQSVLV